MRDFLLSYIRNLIWIYLCCMVCFCYMLILDLIPEHIYITKGSKLSWNTSIPVNIVVQQQNKSEEVEVFRELDYGEYTAQCFLFGIIPIKEVQVSVVDHTQLYISGKLIGVYGKTKGVLVTGFSEITDKKGNLFCPADGVLKKGDYIIRADDTIISTKEDLAKYVATSTEESVLLTVVREGEQHQVCVTPANTTDEKKLLGVWIKDDLAGIGTMTYFTLNQEFGALGHGISDSNTGELLQFEDGNIFDAQLLKIDKSAQGNPGKIEGLVKYSYANLYGNISSNSNIGIYGVLDDEDYLEFAEEAILTDIMYKQDIKLEKAHIYSEISGELEAYEIQILGVNYDPKELNKEILFEVTDSKLLSLTGGIVQGMSGSPIVQDGKIVGAVTHVLVNEPSKGYGIFIEDMVQ